ncbi:DUF5518 domain-containing protein [Natronorubrum sp. DTA7]|uniref:DUF5518 domain-containing protein n=1 Tax=unclassified Natronorubrum TaxID=2643927 RepID=UPI003F834793
MSVNWTAVVIGFVVALVLAFINGLVYAGTDATVLALSWAMIGVLGGLTAGLIAGGTVENGALNGGLATVFGSLIVLVVVSFTTLLFGGLVASFGILGIGLLLLAFYAIPGAIGGAIGSWAKGRRASREMAGTRA